MKKIFKIILVVLWMAVIFNFSNQQGTQSSKLSDGFIIRICNTISGNKLTDKQKEAILEKFVMPVRKGAHYSVYLILGLLSISLIKEYSNLKKGIIYIPLIICFLYASSDEFHQLFIPGRSGEIRDVIIDTLGSFTGILLYYFIYYKRKVRN